MQRKLVVGLLSMLVCLFLLMARADASSVVVREGSRGSAVVKVQQLLIEQGYLVGDADGICGSLTVAAIKKFQSANGLVVDGICGAGTYGALSGGDVLEAADPATSGRPLYVHASAYSAFDPGNSAHTSTGTRVRYGVIAVDPGVIPLGTRVYIPGYGEAVAEDIGGAIKGNRIDIAFDSHEAALAFGTKDLELYILD